MRKISIVLTGVGGQGVITGANILGKAAVKAKVGVFVSEIHGMAQRCGAVVCTVRMGDDTRGLQMKPALAVRILTEGGKELYRGEYVPQDTTARNGLALFARDLTAAQTNPQVGKNPLTIKGSKLDPASPSDIVLRPEEAQKMAPFSQKGTFLEECRVMIVLD